jgi:hypothetical protein
LPCIGAFTLQGVEHFFHAVCHAVIFAASEQAIGNMD